MIQHRLFNAISLLLCFTFLLLPFASLPLHASTQEELEQTQIALQQAEKKQQALNQQTEKLQKELTSLQERLVTLAESVQKGESALSELEMQLQTLTTQVQEKADALAKQQKTLELLLQAALSLSRTPMEAMMVMPSGAIDAMKTARALNMASDDIRKETYAIGVKLEELNALKQKVAHHRDNVATKQAALDKDRHTLEEQVTERSILLEKLGQESQSEAETMKKLAQKAKDLKGLLDSVEEETQTRAKEHHASTTSHPSNLRSFANAKGHIRAPVTGTIVASFGSEQGRDAVSKGIAVKTRHHARVIAPYDGEVVFTGPFLGYGQMVIIRHSDDFHTLLAGLTKIDVEVGQFLLEGEPIGAMGEDDSGSKLYIELRKNNQPVSLVSWMSGFNKKH